MKRDADERLLETTRKRARASWAVLPMLALTLAVLWILLHVLGGGLAELQSVLVAARPGALLAALGLMSTNIFFAALRWSLVVNTLDVHLPYRRALNAVLATWPLALITPSRASDLLRAVAIRDVLPVTEGVGTVLAERLVDIQSLCLLTLAAGLATGMFTWSLLAAAILLAEWSCLLALALRERWFLALPLVRRVAPRLERLLASIRGLRAHPRALLALSVLSLACWVLAALILYALLMAFHADVALLTVLALWPLAIFVGLLPLTLAGMGTRDAAFLALLIGSGFTVSETAVFAATLTYALVATVLPALVALPWMIREMRRLAR